MPRNIKDISLTDISPDTLSAMNHLAQSDGIQLSDLINKACIDFLEQRQLSVRQEVLDAYNTSHEDLAPLYQKLAE